MLEQWKRDRGLCDLEIRALNKKIAGLEGWRHVSTRLGLRVLLNKVACHRQALNQRIVQQETDDEMTRVVAEMTDMPFTQAAQIRREMELNQGMALSPLIL